MSYLGFHPDRNYPKPVGRNLSVLRMLQRRGGLLRLRRDMTSQVTSRPAAAAQPRRDLVERSASFLPTSSEIRQVFICQTAPRFTVFVITYLTGLTMFWIKYRCVAVTRDAIYVLESSKLSGGAKPQSLVGTLPRRTKLGPVSGRWGHVNLLGERHWVHKRFHHDIAVADHEAGFGQ